MAQEIKVSLKVCRTCKATDDLLEIDSEPTITGLMWTILRIKPNEQLKFVCEKCWEKMQKIELFRKSSKKVDQELQALLSTEWIIAEKLEEAIEVSESESEAENSNVVDQPNQGTKMETGAQRLLFKITLKNIYQDHNYADFF